MKITKTFTITTSEEMMDSITRFLACLHLFTHWGHSSILALSQDGDGQDRVQVESDGLYMTNYCRYAEYVCDHCSPEKRVDIVDVDLNDKDYIAYKNKKDELYA